MITVKCKMSTIEKLMKSSDAKNNSQCFLAIGRFLFPSTTWDETAPTPYGDASQASSIGASLSKCVRTWAILSNFLASL